MEEARIKYTGKNFDAIKQLISFVVEIKEKEPYIVVPSLEYDYVCNVGDYIISCPRNGVRVLNAL
jgi:hypothetical protein